MKQGKQETIGGRIRALRVEKGLTQKALSEILQVQRNLVNYWENDERDIKSHHIIALADFFKTTCDYILRGVKAENVEVHRKLGLSDKSVEVLTELKAKSDWQIFNLAPGIYQQCLFMINYLISNEPEYNIFENVVGFFAHEYEAKPLADDMGYPATEEILLERRKRVEVLEVNSGITYRFGVEKLKQIAFLNIQQALYELKTKFLTEEFNNAKKN